MTSASASPAASSAASPFAGAGICVIAGLSLPPGRKGPVFEQDTWDFGHVIGLPAYMKQRSRRLEFAGICNPAWRTTAKEYCAALLAPGHEHVRELPRAYRSPRTLQTCSLKLGELTRWLNWLTAHGVTSLGQVTDWHCEAYTAGRCEKHDSDGNVIATYSNGEKVKVASIALASFSNPDGLSKEGGNLYSATTTSGGAQTGVSGPQHGKIFTNSLEQSNVDLGTEFVNMITVERGYQANSKVITTVDQMMQSLINLKQ